MPLTDVILTEHDRLKLRQQGVRLEFPKPPTENSPKSPPRKDPKYAHVLGLIERQFQLRASTIRNQPNWQDNPAALSALAVWSEARDIVQARLQPITH
jgi:hypothetical protein